MVGGGYVDALRAAQRNAYDRLLEGWLNEQYGAMFQGHNQEVE